MADILAKGEELTLVHVIYVCMIFSYASIKHALKVDISVIFDIAVMWMPQEFTGDE